MRNRALFQFLLLAILVFGLTTVAEAQATRTWVSGVGDDANPCSRTAPCKTFPGAISKTATGGEISVLDPGGFGGVTITKAITIDGGGIEGSILATLNTNGILVNAPTTDTVTIRNLSINGAGSGSRGIRILQAKAVHIEDCQIFGFRGTTGRGIDINLATGLAVNVFVRNTTISNNLAAAIAIAPTSGQPQVQLTVDDSQLTNSASGVFAGEGAKVTINRTTISGNTAVGVDAAGSIVPSQVNIDDSVISYNPRGIVTNGGAAVRISRTAIVNNATNSFQIVGGTISSYLDNYFANNGADSGVLTNVSAQKR